MQQACSIPLSVSKWSLSNCKALHRHCAVAIHPVLILVIYSVGKMTHKPCIVRNRDHSFHGAAIFETGCGGARTRCSKQCTHCSEQRSQDHMTSVSMPTHQIIPAECFACFAAGKLPVLQSVCEGKWIDLYKLWRLVHEFHAAQPTLSIPWGTIAHSLLGCPAWRQDAAQQTQLLYR